MGGANDPPLTIQFWCGIKKTGVLSGPLFLAILAGSASFLSPRRTAAVVDAADEAIEVAEAAA
eukprot:7361847-Prymnesium_polylepis.1